MTTPLLRTASRTVIAAVCLCLPATVLADRAAPDELPAAVPPQRAAPLALQIAEDPDSPVHRIEIPKAVLAELAGDLPGADAVASATPARSIVAALALSAAVACGLVAFRRGRADRLAAALLCGLSLAGAGALIAGGPALADIPAFDGPSPRPRPRPFAGRPESVTLAQGGRVILEIGEDGNEAVVLVVGAQAARPKK